MGLIAGAISALVLNISLVVSLAALRPAPDNAHQLLLIVALGGNAAMGALTFGIATDGIDLGSTRAQEWRRFVLWVLVFVSSAVLMTWLVYSYLIPVTLSALELTPQDWADLMTSQGRYIPLFVVVQVVVFIVTLKNEAPAMPSTASRQGPDLGANPRAEHATPPPGMGKSVSRPSPVSRPLLLLGVISAVASLATTVASWAGAGVLGIFFAAVAAVATLVVTIWLRGGGG